MIRCTTLVLLLCSLASPLTAGNLLDNSGFDTDIGHWTIVDAPDAALVSWRPEDSSGGRGSGSVSVVNRSPEPAEALLGLYQCAPVVGGGAYRLETDIREPDGGDGVTSFDAGSAVITWFDRPGCTGEDLDFSTVSTFDDRTRWARIEATVTAPAAAQSAAVGLWVFKQHAGGAHEARFDDPLFAPVATGPCLADSTHLCLGEGRFRVSSSWRRPDGASGSGKATSLSTDSGYFWFFNSGNAEMVVKVLNGCRNNQHHWVFAGGLTNVEVDLTVEDTESGDIATYRNPIRTPFQPIQDTGAFATCP